MQGFGEKNNLKSLFFVFKIHFYGIKNNLGGFYSFIT
jgi:hypothetical protein|tara:strand:+ start:675 stop:785 length:111 start_codon:yes stop_codon:yes gene_type:complete